LVGPICAVMLEASAVRGKGMDHSSQIGAVFLDDAEPMR
jgi:Zn-finger nucleic acid-binding protein